MFQKYNLFKKILILLFLIIGVFFTLRFLIKYSLGINLPLIKIGLALIESLIFVLAMFLFFQTFKYFRFPKLFYAKRIYENEIFFNIIGVPIYRKVLIGSFVRHMNPRVYLKGRDREYLAVFIEETKQSETSHFIALILTWSIQFLYLVEKEYVLFVSLTLFSILFNFYPIQLLRKNRFHFEVKDKNNSIIV